MYSGLDRTSRSVRGSCKARTTDGLLVVTGQQVRVGNGIKAGTGQGLSLPYLHTNNEGRLFDCMWTQLLLHVYYDTSEQQE